MKKDKVAKRTDRHNRIRLKVSGTAEKPRLSVFKSTKHISVQIIDDTKGATLVAVSTLEKEVKDNLKHGGNIKAAEIVGALIAKRAKEKNIETVVFDRGGFRYHGCVKAIAEKARENGLKF
ncbi:MAG: 50S ribosomal protein L18 [Candidatus Wallbacteria bacterium]|nr:50S ribosomal protein L18 [Candidatus Wallbacteria bacterium]